MADKTVPFALAFLEKLTATYSTPFHLYDERGIRANARRLKAAFAWNPGFREYFAVKACPNPFLMKLLKAEGFGMDCSSLPELLLSERIGVTGESIMFTSNDTPADEFVKAKALGAVINLDDLSHIPFSKRAPACRSWFVSAIIRDRSKAVTRSSAIPSRRSTDLRVNSFSRVTAC